MTDPSPLTGKRVVNTRALSQAGELDALLRERGAIPLSFPCIAIRPPSDLGPLDAALADLAAGAFDWVVFTSANTVEAAASRLDALGLSETSDRGAREPMKGSPTGTEGTAAQPGRRLGASPTVPGVPSASGRLRNLSPGMHPRATPSGYLDLPADPAVDLPTPFISGPAIAARPTDPTGVAINPVTGPVAATGLADTVAVAAAEPAGRAIASHLPCHSPDSPARHPGRSDGAPPSSSAAVVSSARPAAPPKVAVVGPATAQAVARRLGWAVGFVPDIETAAALGESMPIGEGDGVLLPQSAAAGGELAAILRGRGAAVTDVVAYATGVGVGGVDLASMLAAGEVDAVCLTSGSTVRGLLERLGDAAAHLAGVRVACIGTETAAVARSSGLRVDVVPREHTTPALVAALAASFAGDHGSCLDGCGRDG